jgi:predicted MFS family arabinose efflux permease
MSIAFRMVYPLLPIFRDGLGVSLDTLSRSLGLRSLLAAFGPFVSSIADSRGRKTGMLLGISVFFVGTGVVIFWPTFPGFVLATMLTLLGKVTFDPAMQAFIGDRVPYQRRGLALTVTELSWSTAFILGVPLIAWVIAREGWVAPFPLLGGLALIMLFVLGLVLPKDASYAAERPRMWTSFRRILSSPSGRAAMLFTLLICVANELIALVFGVWMEDSFGLQLTALGASAAVLGVAELAGEGLVAGFSDRVGKRRAIMIGVGGNIASLIALLMLGKSLAGALVGLFFFYISFEFAIVSSIPMMTEVVPGARAAMMGFFFTSASLGRASAALLAIPLYSVGFAASVLVAALFNTGALLALRRVLIPGDDLASEVQGLSST